MRNVALAFFFLIFIANFLSAQSQAIIIDKSAKTTIPFATVSFFDASDSRQRVVVADAQGQVNIPAGQRLVNVSCMGYRARTIDPDTLQRTAARWVIELEEEVYAVNELFVTPDNNPAIRIIRNVLANRDKNDFQLYKDYSFRNYFKVAMAAKTLPEEDGGDAAGADELDNFLFNETVTRVDKANGLANDKIIANKTAGFKSPVFGQTAYILFHKAISFYAPDIAIFGEEDLIKDMMQTRYVGPLSPGCFSGYNFELERTFVNGADSIFEINFFPKRHANFESLAGTMFVSSDGFAIVNIIAQPYAKGLIDFKFKQEYAKVDGRWFPKRLDEEIGFIKAGFNRNKKAYPAYVITSVIDSVSFNQLSVNKNETRHFDKIYFDEKSLKNSNEIISEARPDTLTNKEIESFRKTDSIIRKAYLENLFFAMRKIDDGQISFSIFDFDVSRIYTENTIEKSRWGFGFHTNELLHPHIAAGIYAGYGTKDRKLKYGAEIEYTFDRLRTAKMKLSHQNSLKRAGGSTDFIMDDDYAIALAAASFEYFTENKIMADIHILPPLSAEIAVAVRDVRPAPGAASPLPYRADDVRIAVRYALGERHTMLMGSTRMIAAIGNPVFTVDYTRGIDFLRLQSLTYNKFTATIDFLAYNGRVGQSNFRLRTGYIDRPLPPGMLFAGEGSFSNSSLSFVTPNSFQTMKPDEFISDKFAYLFYKHNFGSLLLKLKRFRPELSLTYSAGWGSLAKNTAEELKGFGYKSMEDVYQEGGIIIDNILRIPLAGMFYLRFGAGAFMRMGHYRLKEADENMALKVSFTVSYK
ncbi:MAG: DUF5686 family protein [Tannerellaceae bacterium]|jgi:hypothetical protein|nr:DUF5686 family protein [Tannerellaceae bacterium]